MLSSGIALPYGFRKEFFLFLIITYERACYSLSYFMPFILTDKPKYKRV